MKKEEAKIIFEAGKARGAEEDSSTAGQLGFQLDNPDFEEWWSKHSANVLVSGNEAHTKENKKDGEVALPTHKCRNCNKQLTDDYIYGLCVECWMVGNDR